MDECSLGEDSCHETLSLCTDVVGGRGSFHCSCRPGFNGDNTCDNIDECSLGLDECNATSTKCVDTEGSYVCICKPGFESDEMGLCVSKFHST